VSCMLKVVFAIPKLAGLDVASAGITGLKNETGIPGLQSLMHTNNR